MKLRSLIHAYTPGRTLILLAALFLLPALGACSAPQAGAPAAPAESGAGEVVEAAPADTRPPEAEPTAQAQPTAEPAAAPPVAIVNGTLIDGTGAEPLPDAVVLVQEGVITAVGPAAQIDLPDGAQVIDAQGGAILPGIIEGRASDLLNELRLEDGAINEIDLEVYLYRALRAGVTTIRATGWNWEDQQNLPALREALAALGSTVPTLVVSGSSIAHGEGGAVTQYYSEQTVGAATVDEAVQRTGELLDLGVDQVNVLLAVGPEIRSGRELPVLSREQLAAIVETAHARDTQVVAQAIFADEVETAVAAGVDQLQNWPHLEEPLTEELIAALTGNGVPVISGFGVERPLEGDVRRFLDGGGTLVYGTFAPNAGPLDAPYNEFQKMALAGDMTPMEIIVAATANAARAVGLGDQAGTLEVGKTADILILDGDPLADLRVFRDGVTAVIKGGDLVE